MFIHPKIAGSVSHSSPIESSLTPLAGDIIPQRIAARPSAAPSQGASAAKPSSNGRANPDGLDSEALVRAITDQVMQALNGSVM